MREERQVGIAPHAGGTKYVFAGTSDHERDVGVKVCPRCGQVLFEDMDTCFDCLYSFKKDTRRHTARPEPPGSDSVHASAGSGIEARTSAPIRASDLLSDIELDEIDEVDEKDGVGADMNDTRDDEPMANARHRKPEPPSQDDTIDFAMLQLTERAPDRIPRFCVVLRTKDMKIHIPVSQLGLTVGRGENNDIVLRSRLVSRRHLCLTPQEDGVTAQDCGATNPTLVRGKPLEGSILVGVGDLIDICGITLELEAGDALSESAA